MPYISCQHAMPHFEIFNERNEVVFSGFFTTAQEALEYVLDSAAEGSSINAKFYHIRQTEYRISPSGHITAPATCATGCSCHGVNEDNFLDLC